MYNQHNKAGRNELVGRVLIPLLRVRADLSNELLSNCESF